MPSDERALGALRIIEPGIERYQAALAVAAERIDAQLDAGAGEPALRRSAAALGEFASERIDVGRFAALLDQPAALDHLERSIIQRARDVLREMAVLPHDRFIVDVPPGGRISGAVGNAFAELGCSCGAMLVAELVRTGRYDEGQHSTMLHGFPRHHWNRTERGASPPVVVTVDGADCWAGEIAQYLDGNQKIVLVVRAPSPPAALVRLITPGTLVMQTSRLEALSTAMRTDGPAVVALVPEGAAEFVHVPDARRALHERITISAKPQGPPKALQSWTSWQQQEELQQLLALAAPPPVTSGLTAATGNGATPPADPADRLAAWLLSHAVPVS